MTYTTETEKQTIEKFNLIRLEPARFVNNDLTLNGGLWEITFPFYVSKIEFNGEILTKVNSSPLVDEYTIDQNNLIKINLLSAPSSYNAVIIYYYVFVTNGEFKYIGKNPLLPNEEKVEWSPVLLNIPVVTQSIENVLNGKISISQSNIELINDNFKKYLTENDSFYKKEIIHYECINDVNNIRKVFVGRCTGINLSKKTVVINVDDNFGLFDEMCSMGDNSSYTHFGVDLFTFGIDPNKFGKVRPFIFGKSSPHTINQTPISTMKELVAESLYEGVCINYSETLTTSNNRDWGLCRTTSDGFIDFGFTPSNINTSDIYVDKYYGTNAQIKKFQVGDSFKITQGFTTRYTYVTSVDLINNLICCYKVTGISTGAVIHGNNCPTILIYDNQNNTTYIALYERDYTATVSTTNAGNKKLDITFVNNFETNIALATPLDPKTHSVRYKVRPDTTNAKHGSVLKYILEKCGFDTNATSFTNANNDLDANACFSIPYYDESDYGSYSKYIEDLLASTLSFLYLDENLEINYKLFSTPNDYDVNNDIISDFDIVKDTFKVEVDYKNIKNQLVAYNPHADNIDNVESSLSSGYSYKSKYLHNINKVSKFRHLLADITSRLTFHLKLNSERSTLYKFETKNKNLSSLIGQDFLLKNKNIIGELEQKNIKIIQISRSNNTIDLIASDLYNL